MAGLPEAIPVVAEHFAGATANMEEPYEQFGRALEIAQLPNVYVKLGGLGEITRRPPTLVADFRFEHTPPFVEMILEAFGPRRTMWGSDYPPVGNREGYRNCPSRHHGRPPAQRPAGPQLGHGPHRIRRLQVPVGV